MKVPVKSWKAWAPGLDSEKDWQEYFKGTKELDLSQKPDVSFLPAMFRRKLSPLSRMLFSTIHNLNSDLTDVPVVFASRHGELNVSINLIAAELSETPLSPAKFSISVHNSPVGLWSIKNKNTAPNTAVSAGKNTLKMGLIESFATLNTHKKCLLVYADMELNETYKNYKDENDFPVCIALLLSQSAKEIDIDLKGSNQCTQLIESLLGSLSLHS